MSHDFSKYSSIVVYGLGVSGIACLKYLLKQGLSNIYATDDNPDTILRNERVFGDILIDPKKVEEVINENSKIIFAPGIPLYFPKRHRILDIVKKDENLVCDIDLFNEIFVEKSDIMSIGVTGTNGKSTICSFVDYILLNLGVKSSLVGNIGRSIFDDDAKGECLVTEISSFQLDLFKNSAFDVSVISNIADDHIERHGSFENYAKSKLKIFKNSSKEDFLVLNYDDEMLKDVCDIDLKPNLIKTSTSGVLESGVFVVDKILHIKLFDFDVKYDISSLKIKGKHNSQNYALVVAGVLAYFKKRDILDIDLIDNIIEVSFSFSGIRHRMEFLGEKQGVKFVNDSKATNPVSVNYALDAYEDVFLIFGGYDKGADYDVLQENLSKVVKVYVVGESFDRIERFLKKNDVKYEICFNLELAFNKSFMDAKNSNFNDPIVMLSPGCASFDQWRNFEERGDYFCKLFNEIK